MPPEWHRHRRTWMMWPTRAEIWPDIDAVRRAYAEVARTIRRFEPVTMAANADDVADATALVGPDIDVVAIPVDDSWARDAGPCFIIDGRGNRAGTVFRFNAWGGKYRPHDRDAAFAAAVLRREGLRIFASELVAEGGGVSVDGEGTILTTETCFPNANRNPGRTREAISEELKRMLGGSHVVWLPGNPAEVETDGHVDCIAVFARPGLVLVEEAAEPGSEHDRVMRENHRALSLARDAKGRPFELVRVPEAADAEGRGERFCRSYVNSYMVNGGVVIPAYGTPADATARDIFRRVFPDREIAQVAVSLIAEGGGGIHCITQQEPA
ncbi:MAG TPA: agmatine deiminase family protein [Rhizobiales bacterium]|nr:agmatine deiminase family protein [Hyphomicrobiales bacterium]